MNIIIGIANFISNYLLSEPAILMGLVALLGLLVQKKSADKVISGTFKTVVGFLIMSAGAGIVADTIFPISSLLEYIIGIEVSVPGVGTDAFIAQYGADITLIMAFGFLINLLLARFTRFKYIYLTGHQMFWIIFVYLAITVETIPGISRSAIIGWGSILTGLYLTFSPALTQPFMRKVTGNDNIAYGHTTSFGVIIASLVGSLVGDPEDSSENIELPKRLGFMKDMTVSTGIVMAILYIVGVALAGPQYVQENISEGQPAYLYAVLQGLQFSVGITILLMGVGMMIGEIVPAFKGIADNIVPNAIPALDCPVVFNFAPNAVMIGFLSCFFTVLICMGIFGKIGWFALTPPVMTTFFGGGPAGVFGNSTGGWKGAIAGGVVAGLLMSFGQALTVPLVSGTIADFVRWSNDFDYSILTPIYKGIISLFN